MVTDATTNQNRLINKYNPRIARKDNINQENEEDDEESYSELESSSDDDPIPKELRKKQKAKTDNSKKTKDEKANEALAKLKDAMKLRLKQ